MEGWYYEWMNCCRWFPWVEDVYSLFIAGCPLSFSYRRVLVCFFAFKGLSLDRSEWVRSPLLRVHNPM